MMYEPNRPTPRWIDGDTTESTDLWRHFVDCYHGQTVFCDARTQWWYHCDETFGSLCGPYGSRRDAEEACRLYAEAL